MNSSLHHLPIRFLHLQPLWLWFVLLVGISPGVALPLDQRLTSINDPQSAAVVVFDREWWTIDSAGGTQVRREFLCRMLSAEGRNRYGRQILRYNSETETVVIDSAFARTNGRWISLDSTAIRLAPAPEVKWTLGYSQFRQVTVNFLGFDSVEAVYLAYRIEPRPAVKGRATVPPGGIVLFGGADRSLEKTITVDATAPFRVRWEVTNGEIKPLVISSGNRTIATWSRLDCPPLPVTPTVADPAFILPRLVWTTCPDWEALGTAFGNLFWDKVDSSLTAVDSFMVTTPPMLQGMPALMNATRWVQQNVRTVNLAPARVDAALHTADWVFQERYGDPQDKAVLLTALLRGYGFGPIPVLVPGRLLPFSELPVLEQFSRVILAVPTSEDTLWIDPAAVNYPPTVLPYATTFGKGCLLVGGAPLVQEIPSGDPAARGARTEIRVSLSASGELSGFILCEPQGDQAAAARSTFAGLTDDQRSEFLHASMARGVSGVQITSYSISDLADLSIPVAVQVRFAAPDYARRDSTRLTVMVPPSPFDFGRLDFDTSMSAIAYPIALPPRARFETLVTVVLPEGYAVMALPSPLIIDNPYVHVEISSRLSAQSWNWEQVIEIKKDLLPAADYALVRDAFRSAQHLQKRQAIFSLKPPPKTAPTHSGAKRRHRPAR